MYGWVEDKGYGAEALREGLGPYLECAGPWCHKSNYPGSYTDVEIYSGLDYLGK
jgi:hypothetical protein